MNGKLTTHVLNTATGRPAAGMNVKLFRCSGRRVDSVLDLIGAFTTNADGRTDGPLLHDESFAKGDYTLCFFVEEYLVAQGNADAGKFLTEVVIKFRIDDTSRNYHVPLLVSPWAYSTYRGS